MEIGGKLSIVGTPIGNMEDITFRAVRTLKEADVIYCEDTRVTGRLLKHYDIETPLKRLDANIEKEKSEEVIERLKSGENIAYVSDAGTPGISDPGARLVHLVREAIGESVKIESVPGASALTSALSVAGVNAESFIFLGFLPHKKGRQTLIKKIAEDNRASVIYESPHRILKLLKELSVEIGEREVTVIRELTKIYEDVRVGNANYLAEVLEKEGKDRGEFVVIISPLSK